MITLYFNRFSRATRPRWLLEELGVPYELKTIDMRKGEHKSPEYLNVHPLGKLPALVDDGKTVIESLAICQYLAARFADKGLGPTPEESADYHQWAAYAQVTLEPEIGAYFYASSGMFGPVNPEAAAKAKASFVALAPALDAHLTGKSYVCGDRFTAADVIVGSILAWGANMGLLEGFSALGAYVANVSARPAFAKGRSAE